MGAPEYNSVVLDFLRVALPVAAKVGVAIEIEDGRGAHPTHEHPDRDEAR